jgi:predicted nucleotidyltransferase
MLEEAGVPPTSVGLTGSLLIRAHSEHSDIDLVIYDRSAFERARDFVGSLPAEAGMSDALWREAYRRRGCALSFSEYVRHESRKHNKLVVEGAKVDLGLVLAGPPDAGIWQKVALTEIVAEVDDDQRAFEHPARYHVRHPEIFEIVSYTPTFAGQARPGEFVAARGWKERSEDGRARLLIGTSREAGGEFIRVVSETGEPR